MVDSEAWNLPKGKYLWCNWCYSGPDCAQCPLKSLLILPVPPGGRRPTEDPEEESSCFYLGLSICWGCAPSYFLWTVFKVTEWDPDSVCSQCSTCDSDANA